MLRNYNIDRILQVSELSVRGDSSISFWWEKIIKLKSRKQPRVQNKLIANAFKKEKKKKKLPRNDWLLTHKCFRDCILPISEGIVWLKLLSLKSKSSRFSSFAISLGIVPEKRFLRSTLNLKQRTKEVEFWIRFPNS